MLIRRVQAAGMLDSMMESRCLEKFEPPGKDLEKYPPLSTFLP